MLGIAFRDRREAQKRARIDKAEDALRYQQLTYPAERRAGANDWIVVNISQMLQPDEKRWWTKPFGIVLLGVAVQVVAKIFHLN